MKQTIKFLRNSVVANSKTAAIDAIKALTHKAGQPVLGLYKEGDATVRAIYAIGTEDGLGKCEFFENKADLDKLIGSKALKSTIAASTLWAGIEEAEATGLAAAEAAGIAKKAADDVDDRLTMHEKKNAGSGVYGHVASGNDLSFTEGLGTIKANAVTTAKILNNNVTLGKIQNIKANSILGNNTSGSALVKELSTTEVKTLLGLENVENKSNPNNFKEIGITSEGISAQEILIRATSDEDKLNLIAGKQILIENGDPENKNNKRSIKISSTGVADSLSRDITLTAGTGSDVTGSILISTSDPKNGNYTFTVKDNSHNHTMGNITGLDEAMGRKANLTSPSFNGTPKAPTNNSATDNSTQIATNEFVQKAISHNLGAAQALRYKGTCKVTEALPAKHEVGDVYVYVNEVGKKLTVNGTSVEAGDMAICQISGSVAKESDWNIVNKNTDGTVVNAGSGTSGNIPVFDETGEGKVIKDGGVALSALAKNTDVANTYVPKTRKITAGGGLTVTGGGELSSNITISHADTSTLDGKIVAKPEGGGVQVVKTFGVDGYGHVTEAEARYLKGDSYINVDNYVISHKDYTGTISNNNISTGFGKTINAIDSITLDKGHVSGGTKKTITLPTVASGSNNHTGGNNIYGVDVALNETSTKATFTVKVDEIDGGTY